MANIAIKGHATRGREVIELLEMLGGRNIGNLGGTDTDCVYIIRIGYIDWDYETDRYSVFTLEEYLEKFPYKVGDRVTTKLYKGVWEIIEMLWSNNLNLIRCVIKQGDKKELIKADELQPYKEESMEDKINEGMENRIIYDEIDFNRCPCADKVLLILGNNYEIKVEDGKTYVVRKKPQPPKVFDECCDVLNIWRYDGICWYEEDLIGNFRKLLLCRDAYYKLYGKGEGNVQYVIATFDGEISLSVKDTHRNYLLSFSTADVRDAFYENFKELIESCKEFL